MGNVVKFNYLAEALPDRCEIVNGCADGIVRCRAARPAEK
jgi:hypothetical protein